MSPRTLTCDLPAERSDGCIACQPGGPVEIGVITGKVSQTMGLHDSDDQSVAGEKFKLLAHKCGSFQKPLRNRNHLNVQLGRQGIVAEKWSTSR